VSRLKIALAASVSLALLAYLAWSVDFHVLGAELARTHWGWVTLGVVCGLSGLFARARRWRYLFPRDSPPPALVPATMIGYMANNVLPLRAGEFVRVYVVSRRWHHGFWTALATLVVERVLDSLVIVLILGVLVLRIPVPAMFRNAALTVLAVDVAGVLVLTCLAVFPSAGRRLLARVGRFAPVVERSIARVYDTFVRGLDGIRAPRNTLPLVVWTLIVWLLPAFAAWSTLRAFDLDLPFLAAWVVLAFVGLAISIPSAPGYIGVFHFAAAKAVELFGIGASSSVAFAIVFHAGQVIPVTLVGWIFLLREGMSLREAARVRPADVPQDA
jgi:glycosyltransferase 2 family protein